MMKGGYNVKEAINYVITRMATERGIAPSHMKDIIEEAVHAEVTSPNTALRGELMKRFGGKELSVEKFIEEIAKMIDTAHHDV